MIAKLSDINIRQGSIIKLPYEFFRNTGTGRDPLDFSVYTEIFCDIRKGINERSERLARLTRENSGIEIAGNELTINLDATAYPAGNLYFDLRFFWSGQDQVFATGRIEVTENITALI